MLTTSTWATALGGSANDTPVGIAATSDGGYAVVGNTESFSAENGDIWLTRFDANGGLLWSRKYGSSLNVALRGTGDQPSRSFTYDRATDIESTAGGGFRISGYSEFSPGNSSIGWALEVDSAGVVVSVAGNTFDAADKYTSLAGGRIGGNSLVSVTGVSGVSSRFVATLGNVRHGGLSTETFLSELSSDGVVVGRQGILNVQTLVASSNGKAVVLGSGEDGVSITKTAPDGLGSSFYGVASVHYAGVGVQSTYSIIRKLSEDFSPVWEVSLPGDCATSIRALPDGGFVVALITDRTSAADNSSFNIMLTRLNSDGGLVWAKTYGGLGTEGFLEPFRTPIDLVVTADGFAFTTSTNSFGTDDANTSSLDYWVVKTDLDGNIPIMTGVMRDVTADINVTPFVGSFGPGVFQNLGPNVAKTDPTFNNFFFYGEQDPDQLFPLDRAVPYGGPLSVTNVSVDVVPRVQSSANYNAGSVQFVPATYQTTEDAFNSDGLLTEFVDIVVTRTGGAYGSARIDYSVIFNGSTTSSDGGIDSDGEGFGYLEFANGETTQTFRVSGRPDTDFDPGESFTITLSDPDPQNGVTVGALTSATVSIINTDPAPGVVQFSAASYVVDENKQTVTVTVNRTSPSVSDVNVSYAVIGGTATGGVSIPADYDNSQTSGTLFFSSSSNGEEVFLDTSRTITIPIFDDPNVEGDETIQLQLSNPTNGGLLGSITTTTITIRDIEPVPQLIAPKANGKIAFVRDFLSGGSGRDLFVMNSNGSSPTNVTNSPDVYEEGQSWSPDGLKLAYAALDFEGPGSITGINVINADGTGRVRLTQSSTDAEPVWSPDGTRIAFTRRVGFSKQLMVMNANGSNVELVHEAPYIEMLRWSPDGTHIAYKGRSFSTDNDAIFEVGSDGFGSREVFPSMTSAQEFSYTPDGTQLVFRGTMNVTPGIYRGNVNGTGTPERLADSEFDLFLSPDGTRLAFVRDNAQIFTSNLNGSQAVNVSNSTHRDTDPIWQPVATAGPNVTVNIVDASLKDSDNSSVVTFVFSETVTGFTAADVVAVGGTLSAFSGSGSSYSATFTATDGITSTGSVTVGTGYTNASTVTGKPGRDIVTIDTRNPTVVVNIADAALNDLDNSSSVTFVFNEPVTGFTAADVTVAGGTLSAFSGSGSVYSATLTATSNTAVTGSVSVGTGYTDAVGNTGTAGSDTVAIDTRNSTLTVNIVDASLRDADNNSLVTFTFSEPVTGFTADDVAAAGGTLSAFSGSGSSYSATFTAKNGVATIGSVAVGTGYLDAVGNIGTTAFDIVSIDTLNPRVSVNIADSTQIDSNNSSLVLFVFSEPVTGFTAGDLTVVGGTLSGFAGSGVSYSATFTATNGIATTGSVTVGTGYADAVGNTGITGSDTVAIDTTDGVNVTINLTASQKVVVETSGNNLQVVIDDVVNSTFSGIVASTVQSITVNGGTGANLINLQDVTVAAFPRVGGVIIIVQAAEGNDSVVGSEFGDQILGGDGNDNLDGGLGNDTLTGGAGIDTLAGGNGAGDVVSESTSTNLVLSATQLSIGLSGSAVVDSVSGFEKAMLLGGGTANILDASAAGIPVSLFGGGGNDLLIGGNQADNIDGQAGNDTLTSGAGNDTLNGGLGIDAFREIAYADFVAGQTRTITLTSASLVVKQSTTTLSTDSLVGFEVADLTGGTMRDFINAADFANSGATTLSGGGGNDVITGTAGADMIFTLTGADSISGGGGSDTVFAGNGNDTINGGDGADNLNGQNGNDSILGDAGNDVLIGGAGVDTMSGGLDNDFLSGQTEAGLLSGGEGNDTLQGNTANDTLNGDAGDDRLYGLQGDDLINAGDGADSLLGAIGNDSLNGGAGADTLQGDLGNDTFDGGADSDRINEVLDTNITITPTSIISGLGVDTYSAMERIQLSGGASNNLFDARQATVALLLAGGVGNDTLLGGSKGDGVIGGDGDDVLSGGAGVDIIDGGNGNDYWLEKADADFTVNGATIASSVTGSETPISIERIVLIGGIGANKLDATMATVPVVLIGGRGNDTLLGGSQADTLSGGNRNDSTVAGSDGVDSLNGGNGADILENDQSDVIVVGAGDTTVADVFALLPSWIDAL